MIRNYIKTSFRSLTRQRSFTLINILGLSVGLTVCLLMLHWVQDEMQVDQFHEDGEQVFRVLANLDNGESGIATWESTPYPLLDYLPSNFPEIEEIGAYDPTNKKQFTVGKKEFLEDGIFATKDFFKILTFPIAAGNVNEFFTEPNTVTISKDLAEKLFGDNWKGSTIGETVDINGRDYKVAGVFENTPRHSSLQFAFVLNLNEQHPPEMDNFPWGDFDSRILVKLKKGTSTEAFTKKIADAIRTNNQYAENVELILQPYERQYLHGQFENGKEAGGRIEYVRLFGLAGLFLLLIACINFMNLATARASNRAKEVGVRKTIGAGKGALVMQYMTESLVVTFCAVVVAVLLGELLMPFFQDISGKALAFDYQNPSFWLLTLGTGLFTALVAGSYPAFFLSSFKIVNVLKGKLSYQFGGNNIRKGLVVFQFALSTLLVVCAMVVQSQVDFIKNKQLGLDKENVLYFRTPPGADDKLEAYKNELLRISGVEGMTFTSSNPLSVGSQTGDPKWEGMQEGDGLLFKVLITDHRFLETMNIPLAQGRDFEEFLSMDTMSFLVNETAARAMHMDEPLGKKLNFWGVEGPIVGVVKDFHIGSLHETIGPLIVANMPEETGLTMLKINPDKTEEVIAASQILFNKFSQGHPFRYDFLDDRFFQQYQSEQRTGHLASWFAMVALFISCLGLLGLSAFIAEQKTKEIGIRKVLGASISRIVSMMYIGYLKLVMVALVFAFPLSWYLMEQWLQNFAYQVKLGWEVFVLAGFGALLIALFTVGTQGLKAAIKNPVDALRSE